MSLRDSGLLVDSRESLADHVYADLCFQVREDYSADGDAWSRK